MRSCATWSGWSTSATSHRSASSAPRHWLTHRVRDAPVPGLRGDNGPEDRAKKHARRGLEPASDSENKENPFTLTVEKCHRPPGIVSVDTIAGSRSPGGGMLAA